MDRPRLIRGLRIAWSVVFGIICVVLIVLWVRSYSRLEFVHCPLSSQNTLFFKSHVGRLSVYAGGPVPNVSGVFPSGWGIKSWPQPESATRRNQQQPGWSFGWDTYGAHFLFPHWLPILLSGLIAVGAGLRRPDKFSLRTLLIATTLIAVVLGIWTYLRT